MNVLPFSRREKADVDYHHLEVHHVTLNARSSLKRRQPTEIDFMSGIKLTGPVYRCSVQMHFIYKRKDELSSVRVNKLTYNLPYETYRSGDVESLWGYSGINERPHG